MLSVELLIMLEIYKIPNVEDGIHRFCTFSEMFYRFARFIFWENKNSFVICPANTYEFDYFSADEISEACNEVMKIFVSFSSVSTVTLNELLT